MTDAPEPGAPPRSLFTACRRIPLPDPYPPGVVCVFLLDTPEGPWLVDAGPPGPRPHDALRAGLAACRVDAGDVRGMVLTHAHLDHVGGLGDRRPPRIVAHEEAAVALRAAGDRRGRDRTEEVLRRAGVPGDEVPELVGYREPVDPELSGDLSVTTRLEGEEGDLPWGGGWRWLRVRGHAPGHLLLRAPVGGHLLVGDQFLLRLKTPYEVYDADRDPVGDYLESLRRVAGFAPRCLHSSHTGSIEPAGPWIRGRRESIEGQLERIGASLEAGDTAREVLDRVYPRGLEPGRRALLLREVLALLRHLAAEGSAERRREGDAEGRPVERFVPAGDRSVP